jgi:hypothetical protein
MDLTPRLFRLHAFHRPIVRLVAGAAAAATLLLAVPAPATAAQSPTVTINNVTVVEGTGGTSNASFTIQVAPHPRACCSLQVNWATAPGSATAPSDYTTSSGTVSLTRTVFSKVVTVPVITDTTHEATETFVVNLSNLVGSPGQIGDAQGLATITDDDPLPLLSVNDVSVTEGNADTTTATFTASLSATSGKSVTFDWTTTAGSATAGVDYVAASGSRTIPAGATTATVGITVNGDLVDESDETFGITLSNPGNATIGDGSGLATIVDDDAVPVLSVNDVSVTEGNAGTTTARFTVTLSAASGKAVTFDWSTAAGSATAGVDYVTANGSRTTAAGATTATVDITVNGDTLPELDETFRLILGNPGNATIGDSVGVGTIIDDELEAVIDIDEPTLVEGQSGTGTLGFSVTLSHATAIPVTVDWNTAPGTASDGTDFLGASGTVTFLPLDISETVQVTVNGDLNYEWDETLTLDLSNGTGAPIGDAQGIGTIVNDDTLPIASVTDASIIEGNAGTSRLSFTVSLAGASDVAASVDYATTGTAATAGSDFVSASGALTIPAGTTSGTVHVVVNGDVTYESNETLSLMLSNPTDATVGDGTAQGTILNDDKRATSITLKVVRKPRALTATGLLEPTRSGHRVTATLFREQGTKYVKIAAKTISVRYFMDRDGDGKTDGSYAATFVRPKTAGTYKIVVRFKGATTYKPCGRAKVFTVSAS